MPPAEHGTSPKQVKAKHAAGLHASADIVLALLALKREIPPGSIPEDPALFELAVGGALKIQELLHDHAVVVAAIKRFFPVANGLDVLRVLDVNSAGVLRCIVENPEELSEGLQTVFDGNINHHDMLDIFKSCKVLTCKVIKILMQQAEKLRKAFEILFGEKISSDDLLDLFKETTVLYGPSLQLIADEPTKVRAALRTLFGEKISGDDLLGLIKKTRVLHGLSLQLIADEPTKVRAALRILFGEKISSDDLLDLFKETEVLYGTNLQLITDEPLTVPLHERPHKFETQGWCRFAAFTVRVVQDFCGKHGQKRVGWHV